MTPVKLLCLCFSLLLVTPIQAWAPAAHPDPTKLPKALEFAEKAWKFPTTEELHYPLKQSILLDKQHQLQERRYPWSPPIKQEDRKDESLSCMEDGDRYYYFDGHLSASIKWPTRQAFLSSLPKPGLHLSVDTVVGQDQEESCDDYYYDDSGDVLCWATVGTATEISDEANTANDVKISLANDDEVDEKECEHTYFDRIGGEELCWATFSDVAETVAATKRLTSHPGHVEFDEDCEEPYYDDTGDILCWAI